MARTHRLPQRLDYALIPAPLDLSLPLVTEKSKLPAIIVTPSSPSHSQDFSIAFLAPPPKPTIKEWLSSSLGSFMTRTILLLTLLFFVLLCHLMMHRFASREPFLQFAHTDGEPLPSINGWMDSISQFWTTNSANVDMDTKRDFVIDIGLDIS